MLVSAEGALQPRQDHGQQVRDGTSQEVIWN